jgi:hypothetical protein
MNAVILSDKYECRNQLKWLKDNLTSRCIKPLVIHSIQELPALLKILQESGDEPFIFYKSPWEWVDMPEDLLQFHSEHRNFANIGIDPTNEIVSYIPSYIELHADTILNKVERYGEKTFNFLVQVQKITKRPQVQAPRIFITSHNRQVYFELSLNSLLNSVDESVPVTILLNEPSEEVRKTSKRFVERKNVDILEIRKNCFYSSINLGLQWYKPSVFTVMEDDFILPPTVNEFHPDWCYHFVRRLEHFDLVGWSPNTDNAPTYHRFRKDRKPFGEWSYGGHKFGEHPVLLGNCLTMKLDFWKTAVRNRPDKWLTALDNVLHAQAHGYCTPALKGYHIGWNQKMDGFGSFLNLEFSPPSENFVKNLATCEERQFRLSRVLESDW